MARKESEPNPEPKPLFSLGQVVSTLGALEALSQAGQDSAELLARHASGNWGELDKEDRAENDISVKNNLRILSAYILNNGVKV